MPAVADYIIARDSSVTIPQFRELGNRLPAIDDLHRRIRRAFKEHNIEIPFPQRDLHIRSNEQAIDLS